MRIPILLSLSALLFTGCGSSGGGGAQPAPTSAATSPGAPGWAVEGDKKTDEGSFFVCEGTAATEDEALTAAQGICSAKICALCGVEVKAVTQTTETLTAVDVERKVVETCRRVRKSEDDVRYKQSGCGPDGCTSWLQIFFSKEAEARECKAYASEDFADPDKCEELIESFRNVQGPTAAAFEERTDLLTQAIVACADIDVRPTPRIQALDEVLWQGVLTPAAIRKSIDREPRDGEINARIKNYIAIRHEDSRVAVAKGHYKVMDRQPLIETKMLVDRITRIRDEMAGYTLLMAMWETMLEVEYVSDDRKPALLEKMAAIRAVGPFEPQKEHFYVADSFTSRGKPWHGLRDWLMKRYAAESLRGRQAGILAGLCAADGVIADEEWRYFSNVLWDRDAVRTLFRIRDHGAPGRLVENFVAVVAAHVAKYGADKGPERADDYVSFLTPEELLQVADALPEAHRAVIGWHELHKALDRLPVGEAGRKTPEHADIMKRLTAMLVAETKGISDYRECSKLDSKMLKLEEQGVDTKMMQGVVCACLENEERGRRVGDFDELYLRAIQWNAPCVRKR